MNLIENPWIPVRAHGGTGAFRLLTYRDLLCQAGDWRISLPRDDMELACIQLLVSMTQVMFLPETLDDVEDRIAEELEALIVFVGIVGVLVEIRAVCQRTLQQGLVAKVQTQSMLC